MIGAFPYESGAARNRLLTQTFDESLSVPRTNEMMSVTGLRALFSFHHEFEFIIVTGKRQRLKLSEIIRSARGRHRAGLSARRKGISTPVPASLPRSPARL